MNRPVDPELARSRGGALEYALFAKNNTLSLQGAIADLRSRAHATLGNHAQLVGLENPLISSISALGDAQRLIEQAIGAIQAIDVTTEASDE